MIKLSDILKVFGEAYIEQGGNWMPLTEGYCKGFDIDLKFGKMGEELLLPSQKVAPHKVIENDYDFKCSLCNTWSGKNKASLGAHMRNCKSNPKNKDEPNLINYFQ